MAIADFSQLGNGASAACRMIAVYGTVGTCSVMNGRIFLNANDIAEVDIQQYMHTGISHILAPQELAQRGSSTPQHDLIIVNTILCKDLQRLLALRTLNR